ncbi:MAG: hypothetical protein HKN26_05430, partial [Acidimicrobiales bacterium]|nr:hypothetical protein [Acidimicrobiales bacterium]
VLMGSVWLLLVTNTGIRLGTLVALAGFFGWMAIMAMVWWLYGIGYEGDSPSWRTIDINVERLEDSILDEVHELPSRDELIDTVGSPFDIASTSGDELLLAEFNPELEFTDEELATFSGIDIAYRQLQRQRKVEQATYSEVAAIDKTVVDDLPIGGWDLLSTADAGEAQAQASADLQENGIFPDTSEYIFLEAYERGGKPVLPDDPNRWDRISLWITNSARIFSPPKYAVIQVQGVINPVAPAGQPPSQAVLDPDAPVISVIMERDLGNERFPPFMVMVGSLVIFLALCYLLHIRDQDLDDKAEAFAAELAEK